MSDQEVYIVAKNTEWQPWNYKSKNIDTSFYIWFVDNFIFEWVTAHLFAHSQMVSSIPIKH